MEGLNLAHLRKWLRKQLNVFQVFSDAKCEQPSKRIGNVCAKFSQIAKLGFMNEDRLNYALKLFLFLLLLEGNLFIPPIMSRRYTS